MEDRSDALLRKILEEKEYVFSGPEATGKTGLFEVFLGLDFKERERVLEALLIKQQLTPKSESNYFLLTLTQELPFQVKDFACSDIARTLSFFNANLDFPCFSYNEVKAKVAFKYVWLGSYEGINAQLVDALLGLAQYHLDLLSPDLERVALGEITFNELLEEGLQSFLKLGE